jgi:predicted regulator of Ras-like GTPase activity (Roadblock/LC7/MglB family)
VSDIYRDAVLRLSHVPGVSGALVVDVSAGVPVVEELKPHASGTAIAALAASLFQRTQQASDTAGFGGLTSLQLSADHGQMFIAGANELIVVALLEDDAQIGRVRMEANRAARTLRGNAEANS